ncbi:MAG: universal stress protein [Phycisphaerales bacterium]
MYAKILVALENSDADEAIITHVRELAALHLSEVVLVHVADGFAARYQDALNLEDSAEIREDRAYLERVRETFAAAGLAVRTVLEAGDPATRLVAVAEHEHCDLIAMATHRHGMVQDVLRGSVAYSVRHRTQIPVLLVPAR